MLTDLTITDGKLPQSGGGLRSTSVFDVRIPQTETVDVAAELARLRKEEERLTKDIAAKVRQLADPVFLSRAPEKIVQSLKATLEERRIELEKVRGRIKELESGN